ncbi:uncharacterized protein TNCV_1861501 [Trichonephila clavipes]|nr:uncharacterized protein TNCV_1861501 [Trichonephila clavipes]
MVLEANDRRTSCPCHDEFRGPRSDYVRQVASENNNNLSYHQSVGGNSCNCCLNQCPKTGRSADSGVARGLLATDHVILNHGQVTWTTPEPAPLSPYYHTAPHHREDVSALDRYSVHRCPTRRVFSGGGHEKMILSRDHLQPIQLRYVSEVEHHLAAK